MHRLFGACSLTILLVSATPASASVIAIGAGSFGAGSTLTDFSTATPNGEVNGATVNGILFGYSLGNGALIFDGGPGVTNNVNPLNIVSVGSQNEGTLSMTLPGYVTRFGYGFAVLTTGSLADATTISLFDGASFVGSLVYAGASDPSFTGGFAGIESTLSFNRVAVTFNSVAGAEFALDNIRTQNAPVPEPATATLVLIGAGLAAAARRKATHRN